MSSIFRHGIVSAALFLCAAAPCSAQRVVKLVVNPLALRLEAGDSQGILTEVTSDAGVVLPFERAGVVFASLDTTVVTVTAAGSVIAVRPGRTEITVRAGTLTRRISVIVSQAPGFDVPAPAPRPARPSATNATGIAVSGPPASVPLPASNASGSVPIGVTVEPARIRLLPNERLRPTVRVRYADGTEAESQDVSWVTLGAPAGVLEATGEVIGVTPGEAIVGATLRGTRISASAFVDVVAPNLVPDRDSVLIVAGKSDTIRLLVPAQGRRVVDQGLTWKSTEPSILRVLNAAAGIVQALAPGTAFLNVDGYNITRTLPVRVSARATRVEASIAAASPLTLGIGSELTLSARALDSTARVIEGASVQWRIRDTTIATVDGRGAVLGLRQGTTVLTAEVAGVEPLQWPVTVAATSVVLDGAEAGIIAGVPRRLLATLRGAENRDFGPARRARWNAADPGVVSVDSTGVVIGRKPGSTLVIAAQPGAGADTVRVIVSGRVLVSGIVNGVRGVWQFVSAGDTVPELLLSLDTATVTQAVWSPDRMLIAATMEPLDRSRPARLVVMSADGTNLRAIGEDVVSVSDPAWTRDGTAILTAFRDGKRSGIAHVPLRGGASAVLALSTDLRFRFPLPSTDTADVLARSERGSAADVVRLRGGSISQTILTTQVREELLGASPDGRLLLAVDTTGRKSPGTVILALPGADAFSNLTSVPLPPGVVITDLSAGDEDGTVIVVGRARSWNGSASPMLMILRVRIADGSVKVLWLLNEKDAVTARAR